MATKGIENWPISTTPLLTDTSSRENRSEYLHQKSNIDSN